MVQKVYTDADLFDPKILRQANEDITTIQNCLRNNHIDLSDSTILVLDVFYVGVEGEEESGNPQTRNFDKDIQTTYHLADHDKRVVFSWTTLKLVTLGVAMKIRMSPQETHLRNNCRVFSAWF